MLRKILLIGRLPASVLLIALISIAALWIDRYGIPALPFAVLLGIGLNAAIGDAIEEPRIGSISALLLQCGIALLGLRITYADAASIGFDRAAVIAFIVIASIPIGIGISNLLGLSRSKGVLAGIGTGICGATAILAAAAGKEDERATQDETGALVIGIVVLSTIAMLVLPILAVSFGLNDAQAGFFLGASIQNVPQAIGAGFAVSPRAGEIATMTKMFRVSMLAPVLLLSALILGGRKARSLRDGIPFYLIVFIVLALLVSLGFVPDSIRSIGAQLSNMLLVVGIAAIGLMTSMRNFIATAGPVLLLLTLNAAALCLIILGAIRAGLL